MGITIAQIQDANLRELAAKVDDSFEGETKGNKVLDDCEMGIFTSQVKAAGLDSEYEEFLKIHKQTQAAGKVSDANTAAKEKTRLEANVQKAEAKVKSLRTKFLEIKSRPKSKKLECSNKGAAIGFATGFALGIIPELSGWGGAMFALGIPGMLVGAGIGLGVYYLTRSKNEEKAYIENNRNEYIYTQAKLKEAEQELQQSIVELQDFMNNL